MNLSHRRRTVYGSEGGVRGYRLDSGCKASLFRGVDAVYMSKSTRTASAKAEVV